MAEDPVCSECLRLLEHHARTKRQHESVLAELRQSLIDKNSEVVTALILSEAAALRERLDAEATLGHHNSVAHGRGEADASSA